MTSKKALSERDICTQFIVPALKKAGWNIERQVREEVFFTDGRIYVRGTSAARGSRKRADFIRYYKPNIPIAVIEAKDNSHFVGSGMQPWWNNRESRDAKSCVSTWKVSIDTLRANGFNLDIKNPHIKETGHTHTSAELLELLHQSFQKSDGLLQVLRKELGNDSLGVETQNFASLQRKQ